MHEFLMPSLGADMEDGQLVEWEKRPGDAVARGDVIAVVETQKGAIEIEVFEDGVLESILIEPGTSVPVGTPLALIRADSEKDFLNDKADDVDELRDADVPAGRTGLPASEDEESVLVLAGEGNADDADESMASGHRASVSSRRRTTPAARRRAAEAGVGLVGVIGSGPNGAILLADVEAVINSPIELKPASESTVTTAETPSSSRSLPSGMRDAIAAAMTHSKREIPHYYLAHSADLTAATDWLSRLNAKRSPPMRVPMASLFIAAVARAARRHPRFNGYWTDGAFKPGEGVHVGMAIRLRGAEGGLVAPALHDADKDDAEGLALRLRDLVERVRAGRIRSAELADPTLTVSSVGERGVEMLYGVIHPPQVCLIGIGAPRIVARVKDGKIVSAPIVSITLAADHRVTDGHAGSRFLAEISRRLEDPEALFESMQ